MPSIVVASLGLCACPCQAEQLRNMEGLSQGFQRLARRIAGTNYIISFLDRQALFRQRGVEQSQNQRSS